MTPNPTTKRMSEAEVLAVIKDAWERMAFSGLHEQAAKLGAVLATIEPTFAGLAELRANAMLAETSLHHSMSSAMALEERAVVAESDRTALLEVVRRLLPYARKDGERRADAESYQARVDISDAEAILSRIEVGNTSNVSEDL